MTGVARDKAGWRSWASEELAPVSPAVSEAIVAALAGWLPAAPAGVVVSFLAMPGEVDLSGLADTTDRRLAVTRTPRPGGLLTVHPIDAARHRHPYGFDQPVPEAPTIPVEEIGVVLVPGLVFDVRGGRLGRGAGYYDRFLPTIPGAPALVGVAAAAAVVDELPMEGHDVWMTQLATEEGIREVGR